MFLEEATRKTGRAFDRVRAVRDVADQRGRFSVVLTEAGVCIVQTDGGSCAPQTGEAVGQFVEAEFAAPNSVGQPLTSTVGVYRGVAPDGYTTAVGVARDGSTIQAPIVGNAYVLEGKLRGIELRGEAAKLPPVAVSVPG